MAPKFLVRGCVTDRTAGFYHALSAFVVLSVSGESAMESNGVSYEVFFCAVSSSGTHRSPMITVQKSNLWRRRKL